MPASEGEGEGEGEIGEGEGEGEIGEGEGEGEGEPIGCVATVTGLQPGRAVRRESFIGLQTNVDTAVVEVTWSLLSAPPDSRVSIVSIDDQPFFGVEDEGAFDLDGEYIACAAVRSANDTEAGASCCVGVVVGARLAFAVRWATSPVATDVDVDLYVSRFDPSAGENGYGLAGLGGTNETAVLPPFAVSEAPDACFYGSCLPNEDTPPEWDGLAGRTVGDPTLLFDSHNGNPGEVTLIEDPAAGSYAIGWNYFADADGSIDTIGAIYVDGAAVQQWPVTLNVGFVGAGAAHVTENGTICVEDFTDGALQDDCGINFVAPTNVGPAVDPFDGWGSFEPNSGVGENCLGVLVGGSDGIPGQSAGLLADDDCDGTGALVACELRPAADGCGPVILGARTAMLCSQDVPGQTAAARCFQHGAELFIVETAAEAQGIATAAQNMGGGNGIVIVDGSDSRVEGTFVMHDGRTVQSPVVGRFDPNTPTIPPMACLLFDRGSHAFRAASCDEPHPFACGFTGSGGPGECVVLPSEVHQCLAPLPFAQASADCQSRGSALLSVTNPEWLRVLDDVALGQVIWVGAINDGMGMRWVNGAPILIGPARP